MSLELSIVNSQRTELPGPHLLHKIISESAETSDTPALDYLHFDGHHTTLTYSEFARLTRVLCARIQRHLPKPIRNDQIVPVVIPQCPELYVTWRAVLEAGAGFCPVSPNVPPERLKFILDDVSATIVLCLKGSGSEIATLAPSLIFVEVSIDDLVRQRDSAKQSQDLPQIDSCNAAYVQYTSGSSGLPKGVVVSHHAVTQSLLAHDEHIPTFKRFLQFASPTFDVSIFEVFFPFFRGVTLVACSRERMLSDLPATIIELNADAAELTPTVAGTLLRTRDSAPCLKMLLTIGEMLSRSVVEEFGGSKDRESMLFAMYGPTEAAIHCTIAPRLSASATVRSIGHPLSTVTAFVLDETETGQIPQILPVGQPGELALAGQLASSYLNRPDQNEAAFVELPGYGNVYRTGDRVICDNDGQLEILGRMATGQVKLRGQRVELGEIEEVAAKTHGLSAAIASVLDDSLVLFCLVAPGVTDSDIRNTCRAWLPTFMRPSEIILLQDEVPRLQSGKIDRKQLEDNFRKDKSSTRPPPKSDTSTSSDLIIDALQDVLDRAVRTDSNIWSIGMDSLKAIKLASKLRKMYPKVSVSMLLEAETVADIIARLWKSGESLNTPLTSDSDAEIRPPLLDDELRQRIVSQLESNGIDDILPCSAMQTAMLMESMTRKDLNFNSIAVERCDTVSHAAFWKALCRVAERNRILRSGFFFTDDAEMPFVQVVWKGLQLHELDLLRPLQIHEVADEPCRSVLRLHHALYDGWS